ncbi:lipopolysaccharide assembly protein LapB [Sedimenticola selenatireducens]|uniref:Lipopolysaccharide assembly protein B n=1 Tax=Sedimenticola selenatireducens TaxID=191960 RepID=A0A557SEX8_9GAMM|nr:lipopolysaccharide assembly protein LapB [Sedimenticola selenatireducens]TVO75921.1 lipopolysaccharide assembly protein LapB [Sedimenticola selenatireducens]TVT63780.1 MAG: lipopolysaccharide assembly protein LapB [Sedimenticola selenatireducens]
MMELLWLLLPVAAASGWWAAKRSDARQDVTLAERTPGYFSGLNYLLNEQPDKAIDVFIKMLEVDSDTVETHLALGNLFRRRGEVDRAIRIHQNLIARPTLNREQRAQALLELGQDYMKAGLLDRAESLFTELGEMNMFQSQALGNLLTIYQEEKDWDKCLQIAKRLEQLTNRSLRKECAHFYCELAEEAQFRKDLNKASQLLKKAQIADEGCVRATILQGEIEVLNGANKNALRTFRQVERQDPSYLSEVLPAIIDCHMALGQRAELIKYLHQLHQKHHTVSCVLALTGFIQKDEDDAAAIQFLANFLHEHPNLAGLDRMVELSLKSGKGDAQESLGILQQILQKLMEKRPAYQCLSCGFTAKTLHWHCPSCKTWGSIKPLQEVDEN